MSIKEAANNVPLKDWLKLFLIIILGIGCAYLISYFPVLLFIFAFIGVFCLFAFIFLLYLLGLYLKSKSFIQLAKRFITPILTITKWKTKIRAASVSFQNHVFNQSAEASQLDFYNKINRYVVHNVKNSTKNLSSLVVQLQNQYNFSELHTELLDISMENLHNTLAEFDGIGNIKMKENFEIEELWVILNKLYTSQFKRDKIAFEWQYIDIKPKTVIHIPIYNAYQVFSNLIMNAVEALAESEIKQILVVVRQDKSDANNIQILIADSGHGVSEDVKHKIFTIGFSTHKSSGIGLSYVKNMIKFYGGTITLNNKGHLPYKTTFIIQLPIQPNPSF